MRNTGIRTKILEHLHGNPCSTAAENMAACEARHDGPTDLGSQAQAPAQLDGDDQAQDLAVKDDPPGFKARVTTLTLLPDGAALFHERATRIRLADEAAGEFVEVIQQSSYDDDFAIRIDPSEWPALRAAIDRMVAECRP